MDQSSRLPAGRDGLPVGVSIVTHHTREKDLDATLAHIRELVGVDPHVETQTEDPAPWRVRRGFRRALEVHRDPWPEGGVLLLEDDVRFRQDWQRVLDVIVDADYPTVCCTLPLECIPAPFSAWARAEADGQLTNIKVKPRVAPLVRPISFYGTQAVYLPKWFLPHVISHELLYTQPPKGKAFDGFLNGLMLEQPSSLGLMIAIPDLVDHLSLPSVLNPKRHVRKPHMFHWGVE